MLCIVSQFPWHLSDGKKALTPEQLATWRREHGVTPWTFGCGLYGTPQEVRMQRRALRKALGRFGRLWSFGVITRDDWIGRLAFKVARFGARLSGKSPAVLDQIQPAADLFRGIPSDQFVRQVYFKSHPQKPTGAIDPPKDRCGFIWIGPIVPFIGKEVGDVLDLARPIYARHDFDYFVEILIEGPRAVIVLFGMFYDRNNCEETDRAEAWLEEIRRTMIDAGYPPYRETAGSSPRAFEKAPDIARLLSTIKNALDPDRVIAPGRYGIH
jgi:4-cresol dehydrogenase (hydroxylating)